MNTAALDDLARLLAGRYTIKRLLGVGGMASVYLADDLTLERTVAIKVLPTDVAHDERVVARFQREAKTAAKLDHPHIIPIYSVEGEGILNYFVMKYVEGRSLETALRTSDPQPLEFVRRVLAEAGSALGHAHRKGIVHRDVKPGNIMLDADDRVILMDFGISKAAEATSQLTQTGVIVGTPYYMAPEQVLGREVDGRADQYALAVLAFQMLTGELPFMSENAHAVLYQQVHEAPPRVGERRSDVPAYLDRVIGRALAKKPEDRFATMEDFVRALNGGTASHTAPTAVLHAMPTEQRAPRRYWWAAVAVVVIGASVFGAWRAVGTHATPPAPTVVAPVTDTVVLPAPRADTVPVAAESPRATPAPMRDPKPAVAYLTVASEPYGTLYVDGVEVGVTPRADYPLTVGKRYEIQVEQTGYKTKRETIVVAGPNPIRRHYVLDAAGAS